MKIVFIIKSFAAKAGIERTTSDKMNYLAEKGHTVTLITYEQGSHPLSFPLNKDIKYLDLNLRFFTLKKYNIIRRIIEIICLQIKFKRELQNITNNIQPNIICTTTYSISLIGAILGVKTNAKKILESHISQNSILKENDFKNNYFLRTFARFYDNYTLKKTKKFDALFTLTNGDANLWKNYTNKIYIIPNPVTTYPDQVKEHDITYHRIICAGRLDPQKGFDLLIEAFSKIAKQCKEWHIDIYGSGDDFEKLSKYIHFKGLENQLFIKPTTDNIYDEFQNSDFFVFSSRYEGWGLVLVEAMACGIPTVSFKCDYGPEEIITDKVDGLLVNNGDVNDLASKILWMTNNPIECKNMGKQARETAKKYKKEYILDKWEKTISSLI